jgi:hypothetical protein
MATFNSFSAYAHSRDVHVLEYTSTASAEVGLSSSGLPYFANIAVQPVVVVASEADAARAAAIFETLVEGCAVLSSLHGRVRLLPDIRVAAPERSLQRSARPPLPADESNAVLKAGAGRRGGDLAAARGRPVPAAEPVAEKRVG